MFTGILSYEGERNFISQAHPAVRILWIFSSFVLILICWAPIRLLALNMIAISLLLITIHKEKAKLKHVLKTFLGILLITTLSQTIFFYGYYIGEKTTVIFYLIHPNLPIISYLTMGKGVAITIEGLYYGIIVSLKIFFTIITAQLFIMTTRLSELFYAMKRARIPFKIIILLAATLRFLPITLEEFWRLTTVLKMKGEKTTPRNFPNIIRLMLYNLVRESVKRARFLAISLEMRCIRGKIYLLPNKYETHASFFLISLTMLEIIIAVML